MLMQSFRVKKCTHLGSETVVDRLATVSPICLILHHLPVSLPSVPVPSSELVEVKADRGAAQQLQRADFKP